MEDALQGEDKCECVTVVGGLQLEGEGGTLIGFLQPCRFPWNLYIIDLPFKRFVLCSSTTLRSVGSPPPPTTKHTLKIEVGTYNTLLLRCMVLQNLCIKYVHCFQIRKSMFKVTSIVTRVHSQFTQQHTLGSLKILQTLQNTPTT